MHLFTLTEQGAQQQTCCSCSCRTGQTHRRTPERYIDPALHSMCHSIIDHICQQSKHTFSSCVHCTSVETPSTSAGQHQTPTCTPSPSARTANSRHTHPFNGPFSMTTRVSRYQKGKTNLDFTEPRDSEWQWHQLGHMQVCTSLQTDNHASNPPISFLQAGCPS